MEPKTQAALDAFELQAARETWDALSPGDRESLLTVMEHQPLATRGHGPVTAWGLITDLGLIKLGYVENPGNWLMSGWNSQAPWYTLTDLGRVVARLGNAMRIVEMAKGKEA